MRPVVRALVGVIVLVLIADVAALFTIDHKSLYPSKWDSRISKLAAFVEDARHLHYDHPVKVEFLTEAAYKKKTSASTQSLSAQDKKDIANFEGEARALGLIGKTTSLFDSENAIASGGTAAYYDSDAKEMVIRGTTLSVGLRVTIVHELTHALQDQHFDLNRSFDTEGGNSFFQALAEGDATRIENAYVDQLSQAEQKAYFDEQDANSSQAQDSLSGISPSLLQLFDAPYALGEPMTTLIVDEKGVGELDALFRHPPQSDEGMFNVFTLLDGQKPKTVAAPTLASGEKQTDAGDFGSVSWYLVLASFVDQRTALAAVDGWGGDAYVGYRKNNLPCIRIAFEGDTPTDTAEMAAALNQWKVPFTENTVSVTATANRVVLDACEPKVVPKALAGSDQSLTLPAARLDLVASVLAQGAPRATAECFVKEFLVEADLAKLNSDSAKDAQELFDLGVKIGRLCAKSQPA